MKDKRIDTQRNTVYKLMIGDRFVITQSMNTHRGKTCTVTSVPSKDSHKIGYITDDGLRGMIKPALSESAWVRWLPEQLNKFEE